MIYQFTKRPDGSYCVPFTTEAIKDIFGCSPQDVREDFSPIAKVILPEDFDKVVGSIEYSAKHLTIWTCEYRVQIPGQTIRWILGKSSPEKLADGSITWYGFNTDITERKQAEEDLKIKEEEYRLVVENATESISIVQEGRLKFVNPGGVKILGYPPEVLTSKPFIEFIHPDDREMVMERNIKRMRGEEAPPIYSFRVVRRDGVVRWVEANAVVVPWKGKPAALNFLNDITERKRLEENLEKERQDLKLILDTTPIIVFYKDKEGRFLRVNKIFAEALNMPEGDFAGKTVFDFYSLKIAQGMTDDDQEVLQSRRPKLKIIEQYESASGTRWVRTDKIPICDTNGLPVGLIGFAQDITERKKAEEALKASEERYRTIIETIEDGYYEVDLAGNLTFFNDAMTRINGYTKEEMLGMNSRGYTDAKNANKIYQVYNRVYRTGEPAKGIQYETITKNGERRNVESSASLIKDPSGKPIGFRGIARDVSELRQAEKALQTSEERFRVAAESSNDFIYEWDLQSGRIDWFGKAIERLGDMIGKIPDTNATFVKSIYPD
ncbi:MAG: PAS domain S-box protein, partial [Thermodesulfobacteriota bacterium]